MSPAIYLRPLKLDDAKLSYKWRNNPAIWKFTKFNADQPITEAVETEWLRKILKTKKDYRFAICLQEDGKYLGNVQLINVSGKSAVFHLFIGETSYWGQGIGKQATYLMLDYGFNKLGLKTITLEVHKDNLSAQAIYSKIGFKKIGEDESFIEMALQRNVIQARKLVFPSNITIRRTCAEDNF